MPIRVHKDFWEYDPATNAWTQKADFGGTARLDAVGFSIGSKGYIGTGKRAILIILITKISGNMILLQIHGLRKPISGEQQDMMQLDFPSAAKDI